MVFVSPEKIRGDGKGGEARRRGTDASEFLPGEGIELTKMFYPFPDAWLGGRRSTLCTSDPEVTREVEQRFVFLLAFFRVSVFGCILFLSFICLSVYPRIFSDLPSFPSDRANARTHRFEQLLVSPHDYGTN